MYQVFNFVKISSQDIGCIAAKMIVKKFQKIFCYKNWLTTCGSMHFDYVIGKIPVLNSVSSTRQSPSLEIGSKEKVNGSIKSLFQITVSCLGNIK